MKTRYPLLPALAALLLPLPVSAAVTVENVTAKQRYPWNGKVDISCTVSGIDESDADVEWMFAVAAVMPDTGDVRSASHFRVVRNGTTNSNGNNVSANGDYRLVWDLGEDLGEVVFSNMVVRVTVKASPRKGQLWAGGPIWADKNVGAENPWDYGLYFWWGDTVGYSRKGGTWTSGDYYSGVIWVSSTGEEMSSSPFDYSTCPTVNKSVSTLQSEGWVVSKNGTYVLAPAHDAAQVHWGGSWRMPTDGELSALSSNCDWTWTTTNGVSGYVVRGRGDYAANSIFLPAAGYGDGTSLIFAGSYGYYWSSVPDESYSYYAWYLYFNSGYHGLSNYYRFRGRSVRPVQGVAE
ncbi:MAG: DUF1566 domain-containing protein [Kiritimatiellae bacterium]|nr:DUF1566 domain-containing protein [Kiritimatiellia bacterium]